MKKILNYLTKKKVAVGLLSILLVVCLSAIAFMPTGKVNKVSASTSTAKIKIMSFNLRVAYTDTTPDGGEQAPNKRLPRIKKMLTDESPDIIGFQECTPYWETNLFNADPLTNYNYECMYRATGEEAGRYFGKRASLLA